MQASRKKSSELDAGRFRFLVALGSFLINVTVLGLVRSVGVIYVALVRELGVSRREAAWPFSLCASLLFLAGPLAGILSSYFSIRSVVFCGILLASLGVGLCSLVNSISYIILFFGGLQGIGVCMSMTLSPVIINQYFIRHRTTASGVAYAGGSVGSFLFPPAVEYLMEEYGLKGCFLIFSGLLLHGLIGAALFRPPPWLSRRPLPKIPDVPLPAELDPLRRASVKSVSFIEPELPPSFNPNNKEISKYSSKFRKNVVFFYRMVIDLLLNPLFLCVAISFALFFNCFLTYLTVIVDHAKDKNIPESNAVLIVSAFSLTDFFGRLSIGWLSDKGVVSRRVLVVASFLGMAAGTEILASLSSYEAFLAVSVVYGLLSGTLLINYPTLLTEYVGLERLAFAMGLSGFFVGIVSLTRPYIIGLFRDSIKSYAALFHVMAGLLFLGGLLWLIEPLFLCLCRRKNTPPPTSSPSLAAFDHFLTPDSEA